MSHPGRLVFTDVVLQAAKKLFNIPVASSKAAKMSELSQEEPSLGAAVPAHADTDELAATSEPAVGASASFQEELVPESTSPAAVVIYEQPATSEAAVDASAPSREELVLESASPAAVVIYEQPATSEAAVDASAPSREDFVPDPASSATSQSAASKDAPSPVTKEAAHPSPYRRRFVCKPSPAAASQPQHQRIPAWRPFTRIDSTSCNMTQSMKEDTRGTADRKAAAAVSTRSSTSGGAPATPRPTAWTAAPTSTYAKRMSYTGYKEHKGAGKVCNVNRPRWR